MSYGHVIMGRSNGHFIYADLEKRIDILLFLDEKELRTFFAISLYMGMKRQLNIKSYWAKSKKLFYCPVISGLLTQRRFLALQKCLHITRPCASATNKSSPEYDKMHQCRWLLNSIRNTCKDVWNLEEMCTIDEMMVRYKGKYCSSR